MTDFLFLFRGGANFPPDTAPEEMQKQRERWKKWTKELGEAGKLAGGDQLKFEGSMVSANDVITDGPFAEGKEIIGGYFIVKANNLTEAAEIANDCPIFLYGGTVEVREIQSMEM